MSAKIITIEGTDCSGKETQSLLLETRLKIEGYKVKRHSFPKYETATGKIVGGSYLGKEEISPCVFTEGAVNVDPIVASLYYAADRRYAFLNEIEKDIEENDVVILDRYTSSNLGHQGSKIKDEEKQLKFFETIIALENGICELPISDITVFLHMPYYAAQVLKENRVSLDQHEVSETHLKHAEETYLKLAKLYGWEYINCLKEDFKGKESIKTRQEIHSEIFEIIKKDLEKNKKSGSLKMTRY